MNWQLIFTSLAAVFCSLFPCGQILAQEKGMDSSFYRSALAISLERYQRSEGDQSGLYNGSLYTGYPYSFKKGIPFFLSDRFTQGSVRYDGMFYPDLPILYDELKDIVIIEDNQNPIQLINEKLPEFSLSGHRFIRVDRKDGKGMEGFYELLFPGRICILKKEIKKQTQDLSVAEGIEVSISETVQYFIRKGNELFPVKNQIDLIRQFADKKKEIRQFLKKNKLKFHKDPENMLLRIVAYYEQLV